MIDGIFFPNLYVSDKFVELAKNQRYYMADLKMTEPLPIGDTAKRVAEQVNRQIDDAVRKAFPGKTDEEVIALLSPIYARTSKTTQPDGSVMTDYIINGEVAFTHRFRFHGMSLISEVIYTKSRTSD